MTGKNKYKVGIVGCGSMGQIYADAYSTYPDTEIVALAEYNPDRRKAVGAKYKVKALYPDVHALLKDMVPDIVAVITPSKWFKEAVIACAEAGVKGVSTDKPMAAVLSDADEMVDICKKMGVVYAGGNLMVAGYEVQELAKRIRLGAYGKLIGGAIHMWGATEISGGGCQQISLLRRLTGAEVDEVIAWAEPPEALASGSDDNLIVEGQFHLTSGLKISVHGSDKWTSQTDLWSDEAMIQYIRVPPKIFQGFDKNGARIPVEPNFKPYEWSQFGYLTGSIRSFIAAIETGSTPWVSGHDMRQALEVAIAVVHSARLGSVPVKLPLADRSLSLYPRKYRWLGGDVTGRWDPKKDLIFREK